MTAHKFASVDGRIINAAEAGLNAVSAAALYGRGVFTTIAVFDGKPFLFEKHWQRLLRDALIIGLDTGTLSFVSMERSLNELLLANEAQYAKVRISLFDVSRPFVWDGNGEPQLQTLILTGEFSDNVSSSRRLAISPYRINSSSPLRGVKSCNYLESLMAWEHARDNEYDEAIRLNEHGRVTSACMANIFWLQGDRLFTPSLSTGCLPGTTRQYILEKLECEEVVTGFDVLYDAKATFICSAGIGVKQITAIDELQFQITDHDILHLTPH